MNETLFYESFLFNLFKFKNYHTTDHSRTPVPHHYFGCLIKGTAKFKTQNTELVLNPNEIFYIPKHTKYISQWFGDNHGEIEFYSFGFEISPINQSYALQKINCSSKEKEIFNELCEDITSAQIHIGKLYYFFEQIADHMELSETKHTNATIKNAIRHMTQNPNMKISDIAQYCNISESGIYSLFKRHLRKTPNDIRNKILCDKAILLLTTTDMSVQEISDILNFSSTSYFRKILKKHTNKTPLEIRKESSF